ncbi:MAG: hypothetical protein IMZ64_12435 [Bacteroidetes bacterium]|nr:hypothetical protein [Bacteroidota bacterium]
MKYLVLVLLAISLVSAKPPRIEKILLPDTIKGKYNTVISIDTMKITHHLLDTVIEASADTTILKAKSVTILQEPKPKQPKKEDLKKEEPKKDIVGPPVPVKK